MARSHKIYLLMSADQPEPLACFTVKHEAITFADNLLDKDDSQIMWIIGTPDGRGYFPEVVWHSEDD